MAEPALGIVQDCLIAQIRAALPSLNLFVDRSDTEPLRINELPGVVCRAVSVQIGAMPGEEMAQTMHTATFQFDCQSGNSAGQTIDRTNQKTIADLVAAIHEDRTLGGRVGDIVEQAISGSEMDGADVGVAILEIAVLFFTPRGDFYTLVGLGGQRFTS